MCVMKLSVNIWSGYVVDTFDGRVYGGTGWSVTVYVDSDLLFFFFFLGFVCRLQ